MSAGGYFDHKAVSKREADHIESVYRTISFGTEPKKERSLSVATAATRLHKDRASYTYHDIHLSVPCAPEFRPVLPANLLETAAGICLKCASRSGSLPRSESGSMVSCTHIDSNRLANTKGTPKSILAPHSKRTLEDRNFIKSVSFDTVNVSYSDGQEPLYSPRSDEEDEEILQMRSRWRSQIDRSAQLSPSRSTSPSPRSSSPRLDRRKSTFVASGPQYPTRPIITHDSCSMAKKHALYDDLYAGRLEGKVAKLPNRGIMCYISGRKHTWVAIDWCCNQFLQDGDSLVVVASIRPQGRSLARLNRRQYSSVASAGGLTENKVRNSPEWSQATAENIMKYCLAVLNPNKIVKISVDLCVGSTEEVLSDMFALYQPSLVVTGAKPANNAPTIPWATKRLTDRLVSSLPVPMIIVPSKNMGMFETKLFDVLDERMEFVNANNKNVAIQRDELFDRLDAVGCYSLEDQRRVITESGPRDEFIKKDLRDTILEQKKQKEDQRMMEGPRSTYSEESSDEDSDGYESEGSVDSTNPPSFQPKKLDVGTDLKRMELEYQLKACQQFEVFEKSPLNENSFKDKVCIVLDAASKYGQELAAAASGGDDASRVVRDFIGAPELTRTKSMVTETSTKTDKELQKAMIAKYQQQQQQAQAQARAAAKAQPAAQSQVFKKPTPKISINDRSPSLSPTSSRPALIPSTSQPELQVRTKKKKSFWGLFKQ